MSQRKMTAMPTTLKFLREAKGCLEEARGLMHLAEVALLDASRTKQEEMQPFVDRAHNSIAETTMKIARAVAEAAHLTVEEELL